MRSNNISGIWDKLEENKSTGLVKQLYSKDVHFHILGTYQFPEKYYGIAFSFSSSLKIEVSSFNDLRELKIVLMPDTTFPDSRLLIIQLLFPENRDIFASLCENLIHSVLKLNDERKAARTVLNQLEKWKTLFDRNSSTGLTSAEQQGLFGELHFLQKILSDSSVIPEQILHTWVGTDRALRDFQGNSWALEVKTTSTNNPQKITVNGERQLDENFLENLFLFHISVETSKRNGTTLCQKIADIRKILADNIPALSILNAKLFEAGYLDRHELLYMDRCYQIRSENYYRVEKEFPRIKEGELRSGVSEVRYTILLAMCDQYLVSQNQIFKIVRGA